jgi:hypothetical protein
VSVAVVAEPTEVLEAPAVRFNVPLGIHDGPSTVGMPPDAAGSACRRVPAIPGKAGVSGGAVLNGPVPVDEELLARAPDACSDEPSCAGNSQYVGDVRATDAPPPAGAPARCRRSPGQCATGQAAPRPPDATASWSHRPGTPRNGALPAVHASSLTTGGVRSVEVHGDQVDGPRHRTRTPCSQSGRSCSVNDLNGRYRHTGKHLRIPMPQVAPEPDPGEFPSGRGARVRICQTRHGTPR